MHKKGRQMPAFLPITIISYFICSAIVSAILWWHKIAIIYSRIEGLTFAAIGAWTAYDICGAGVCGWIVSLHATVFGIFFSYLATVIIGVIA